MKNILTLALLLLSICTYSQKDLITKDVTLNEMQKKQIIDSLTQELEEFYIRPNAIADIKKKLNENYKKGIYKNIISPNEFASKLSTDLLEFSKDLHFRVMYDPEWVADQQKKGNKEIQQKIKAQELTEAKKRNFGFQQTRILEGNIGYLEFDYFEDPAIASETAAAAMHFFENTDALIIDLRKNNGGAMEMGQFISSYFYSGKELPLYKYYYYEKGRKKIEREMWLLPSVPGKRLADIDIYILTSNSTFSAAEWMSYSLQNLKRVTIVGEKTAGGAHPIDRKVLPNGFSVNIPFGEVKDPITNQDFEGKGVMPDVLCKSEEAVNSSHLLALQNLSLKNKDSVGNDLDWFIPVVKNRQKPLNVDPEILKSYQGKFGKSELVYEDSKLYYRWNNIVTLLMIPLEQDLFMFDGDNDFRIKIVSEKNEITAIKRIYPDGQERLYKKE
ncbi:S41 family peptidase [Flavobacterium saccharophilum]|uniref:N-terminal domain of Peptidase_S41 n=1 Tax=Flavobacterium saccharophilum TaxID=29534 RepID=A0A1M7DJG9_9FLAO|nr:S41 family peptidase [Flavobacterium saccharophilum]SHL79620.1 N-terminal domain of Peptidase_S41 [Flavobacterium saccharophilum]